MNTTQMTANIERIKYKVEQTFFDVQKVPSETGGFNLVNASRNTHIAKVSDRYTLVKNRDIIQPIIDKFGYENVVRLERTGNKFMYVIQTGREIDIDGNGDMVKEQLVAMNSYNKTKAYHFALGAFRSWCSNGMFYGMAFFNYKKIHVGEIPMQAMVDNVLNTYTQNDFGLWKRMASIQLNEVEMQSAIDSFNAFEVKDADALGGNKDLNEKIRRETRYFMNQNGRAFPRSAWGLYNVLNSSIAHTFRWKRSEFGKVVLANKTAEAYIAQKYDLN